MSQMRFHRNTFLEKEELNRFSEVFSGIRVLSGLLQNSYSFGIVSKDRLHPTEFSVTADSTSINVSGGYLIDSLGRVVLFTGEEGIELEANKWFWLKVSIVTRNYEQGYVQVGTDGSCTGSVSFSGVVRGQSSGVPTCIKFVKDDGTTPLNSGIYQVSNIINDNNITLTGGHSFVAESGLRVVVLGTLPFGEAFTTEQLEGLYSIDSYEMSLVPEETSEVAPEKGEYEFYLARVYRGTNVIIQDKRTEFWRFEDQDEYEGYTGFYVKEE